MLYLDILEWCFLTYCFFLIYKSFCKKIQNFQSLQKIIAVWVIGIIVMIIIEYIQKNKYELPYENYTKSDLR